MNQELGLKILSEVMSWADERAREEFAWLKLMARLKYDGYRDFLAGVRFVESLITWLQQFEPHERETAYKFVRHNLVYIGPVEMQRLVEAFYPRVVHEQLLSTVSRNLEIPKYKVLADTTASGELARLRRKSLFMGLSDGARIDILRHANAGVLVNDQVVVATQLDAEKWHDLLRKLRKDLSDPKARFAIVYLIDDFMGTGSTFVRLNPETKQWDGKLIRFKASVDLAKSWVRSSPFEPGWELCVHHYIASSAAAKGAPERAHQAKKSVFDHDTDRWFGIAERMHRFFRLSPSSHDMGAIHFTFGMVLPSDLPIDTSRNGSFVKLTEKYYDPVLETGSTIVGGVNHMGLGYGGCALPLVLEHNTPNNSVALLWAETDGGLRENGGIAPAMRPLFRRRQRFNT